MMPAVDLNQQGATNKSEINTDKEMNDSKIDDNNSNSHNCEDEEEEKLIHHDFVVPSRFLFSYETSKNTLNANRNDRNNDNPYPAIDMNDSAQLKNSMLRKIIVKQGNRDRGGPGSVNESYRAIFQLYSVPFESDNASLELQNEQLELVKENSVDNPLEFVPSDEGIIEGLEKVIPSMLEGETAEIFMTHHFAYGTDDYKMPNSDKLIPAKSSLILRVHLQKILGLNILQKKSGKIMKRMLRISKDYGGPKFDAKLTAKVKCFLGNQQIPLFSHCDNATPDITEDGYCKLDDVILGFDERINHGLYKCLKTMCKGEKAHFEVSKDYLLEDFDKLCKESKINEKVEQHVCYEVELLNFVNEYDRFMMPLNKYRYCTDLTDRLVECIKTNTNASLLTASHGLKFLKSELRSPNHIDSDAEYISEDGDDASLMDDPSISFKNSENEQKIENTSMNDQKFDNKQIIEDIIETDDDDDDDDHNDEDKDKDSRSEKDSDNIDTNINDNSDQNNVEATQMHRETDAEYDKRMVKEQMQELEQLDNDFHESQKALFYRIESNYSLTLMKRSKLCRALEVLSTALQHQPSNLKLLSRQIQCHVDLKNFAIAKNLSQKLIEAYPDSDYGKKILHYCDQQYRAADAELRSAFAKSWI